MDSLTNASGAFKWSLAESVRPDGPCVIRFRTPTGPSSEDAGHSSCLRIVWPYAEEGSGAMPDQATSDRLKYFEDCFCEAVELDGLAILAAAITFDGARQWVFYTADPQECANRLGAMPQESEPYPIEIDAFSDPHWEYVQRDILQNVGDA